MAAAEYYGEYNPYDGLGRNSTIRREDAPLPPVPTSSPRPPKPHVDTQVSPISSPFDDQHSYPSLPKPSQPFAGDTSYHGSNSPSSNQPRPYSDPFTDRNTPKPYADPFADPNAIPMQSQKPGLYGPGGSPLHGVYDAENQFKRQDSDPRRRGRPRKKPVGPWYKQKIAWFVWLITFVQIVVFVIEIIRNASLTHSPIEIHPQFNPMIGPSPYVLINMGARYVPCMRNTHQITDATNPINFQCPNTTTLDANCQLSDLCGFGGVPNPDPTQASIDRKPEPNQWFRFIIPIFLHAGIIHIGFNMLLQVTMGREMEHLIGSLRFMLVYFSAGIFGFVFGGNFAAPGIASTGASGSLFGILALTLLDLLYNWKLRRSPVTELLFIIADVVISFVLGLLPGLDNFSHIGGFLMGLALGICLLHSPASLRERGSQDQHPNAPYSAVPNPADREYDAAGVKAFARQPVSFFKGRKPLWWAWWLVRALALVGVTVVFIVLLRNFYVYRTQCGWCKYLSCLPVNHWCDLGNLQMSNQTTKAPNRARDIFMLTPS